MLSSNHIQHIVRLAKSTTIKLHGGAVTMNKQLQDKLGVTYDSNDLSTWAYYRNLAGLPHDANSPIYIRTVEDNTEISLSKESLVRYSKTKLELNKYSDFYNTIIKEYPGQELYIRGILNPIPLEVSINAPEGTILYYDKSLVEYNEVSLIPTLEKQIKLFLSRWNVNAYLLTDELYMPSLYGALATFMVNKIYLLRLKAVNTVEINKRYRDIILSSNLAVSEYAEVLSDESALWLTKNIPTIGYNIGKESTLNTLIENLLVPSGIVAKEVNLIPSNAELNDITNPLIPTYSRTKESLYTVSKIDRDRDKVHIDSVALLKDNVTKELLYQYAPTTTRHTTLSSAITNTRGVSERSKFYVLSNKETTMFASDLELDLAIETTLLYTAIRDKDTTFSYTDASSNQYDYTGYQLYLLLMYNLLAVMKYDLNQNSTTLKFPYNFPISFGASITTDDLKLESIKFSTILKSDFNITALLNKVNRYHENGEEAYLNILGGISNIIPTDITIPATDFIGNQKEAYSKLIACTTNTGNVLRSAELSIMRECMVDRDTYSIQHVNDIVEEMLSNIVSRNVSSPIDEIAAIIKTVTGIEIDKSKTSVSSLNKIKALMDRLTSYTVSSIVDSNSSDTLLTRADVGIIHDANIVKITAGNVDCKGSIAELSSVYGDDTVDKVGVLYAGELSLVSTDSKVLPTIAVAQLEDDVVHVMYPRLIIE